MKYPKTKKVEQIDDYHGTKVEDPYRWLEDDNAADTIDWVKAQNEVTFGYLEALPNRARLLNGLTELWNYERFGAPFKKGGRYFFFKNDGLQNQSVLYKQESLDAEPEVLLDPNTLAEEGTAALSMLALSDNGKWLAYGVAASGSDWQEFRVRNIETAKDEPDHLRFIKFSGAAWTHDNEGFFYARYPEPKDDESQGGVNLNQKVYYHRRGTPQSEDRLVYERPDEPEWGFGVTVSDASDPQLRRSQRAARDRLNAMGRARRPSHSILPRSRAEQSLRRACGNGTARAQSFVLPRSRRPQEAASRRHRREASRRLRRELRVHRQ